MFSAYTGVLTHSYYRKYSNHQIWAHRVVTGQVQCAMIGRAMEKHNTSELCIATQRTDFLCVAKALVLWPCNRMAASDQSDKSLQTDRVSRVFFHPEWMTGEVHKIKLNITFCPFNMTSKYDHSYFIVVSVALKNSPTHLYPCHALTLDSVFMTAFKAPLVYLNLWSCPCHCRRRLPCLCSCKSYTVPTLQWLWATYSVGQRPRWCHHWLPRQGGPVTQHLVGDSGTKIE